MVSLLLAMIYLAFIGLGLPDALLGAAWPMAVGELGVPLSYAGIISMIVTAGTIVSSLASDWMTRKLGTGLVTAISIGVTAAAAVGFSISHSFWVLCLFAIPYGLGAGAVDAALNNYVALHYSSRHMSWLHCFWGVGATIGPYIMGWVLSAQHGWRTGYSTVAIIQFALTLVLFLTLPLWKKVAVKAGEATEERGAPLGLGKVLQIEGVKPLLLAFFCYCAFETTAGLWASSYLVEHRGMGAEQAAYFGSMFFLGITVGRFISGFIADRVGDKNMVRLGIAVMVVGLVMIALPVDAMVAVVGIAVFGMGAAPVYPSIIHSTPIHFGKEKSQAIVGVQMASAYCGSTLAPPLFGLVAQHIHIGLYPYYMALFLVVMLLMTERINKREKMA